MPVLLVTGASRGIGAAVATLAAARGYDVALNFLHDEAGADAVAHAVRSYDRRALAVRADVSDEKAVVAMFDAVGRELGTPSALVNNAGITGRLGSFTDLDAADVARVLAVNVAGTMLCAREAVRRMSGSGGGAIVNVSSRAADIGGAGEWLHYAASKGAIETFTVGLAREVAAQNIRVNAVSPGLIETGLHAAAGAPERLERLRRSIPMQRAGTAVEVVEAVLWLLSSAASYVTGAVLPVGGGR
ncbi:MAG: SDR family oxidoreductase [Candidatus Eremiobacteraeota bacterium]|nr:SDR family oxidoreductase [Candidatus Eremiobacteraeota bacterium]